MQMASLARDLSMTSGRAVLVASARRARVPARDGNVGDGGGGFARAHPRGGRLHAHPDAFRDVTGVRLGESRHARLERDGRARVAVDEAVGVEDAPEVLEGLLAPRLAGARRRRGARGGARELPHDSLRGSLNERPAKRGAVEERRHLRSEHARKPFKTCGRGSGEVSDGARVGKRAEVAGRGVSKKRTKADVGFMPVSNRATAEATCAMAGRGAERWYRARTRRKSEGFALASG